MVKTEVLFLKFLKDTKILKKFYSSAKMINLNRRTAIDIFYKLFGYYYYQKYMIHWENYYLYCKFRKTKIDILNEFLEYKKIKEEYYNKIKDNDCLDNVMLSDMFSQTFTWDIKEFKKWKEIDNQYISYIDYYFDRDYLKILKYEY